MSAPANGNGLHKPPALGVPPNELNNSASITVSPSQILKAPSVPGSKDGCSLTTTSALTPGHAPTAKCV